MTHEFPMAKTGTARAFCREILHVLIEEGRFPEPDAVELIIQYWHNCDNIESDPFLYEELPYFYAMCILHHPSLGINRVDWFKDPELWPPPKKWLQRAE
jgi:hypothetical protein